MTSRLYDYKALIDAYITVDQLERDKVFHENNGSEKEQREWVAYYQHHTGLFGVLKTLFGSEFSRVEAETYPAYWPFFLFRSTVRSLLSITTPIAGFLEGPQEIEDFYQTSPIADLTEQNKAAHLELLYRLFRLIYGDKANTVATSEMLLAAGFDDSQQPPFWFV
jgi:hypothetical protein